MSRRYQSSGSCIRCAALAAGREDGVHGATFVGVLCKRGHDYQGTGGSLRYASGRACVECQAEHRRRTFDPVRERAYLRRYWVTDKGHQTRQRWRAKNPETLRAMFNIANHRRRARLAEVVRVPYSRRDIRQLRARYDAQCAYCGNTAVSLDHVVPLMRGGDDALYNLVPACQRCNSSKGSRLVSEWYPSQSFFSLERRNAIDAQTQDRAVTAMSHPT